MEGATSSRGLHWKLVRANLQFHPWLIFCGPLTGLGATFNLGDKRMVAIPKDWIERAARVYKSNSEASKALGIASGSFARLCRKYGIETPYARQEKARQEARSRRKSKGRDRGR